jgi:hypothetical protein
LPNRSGKSSTVWIDIPEIALVDWYLSDRRKSLLEIRDYRNVKLEQWNE